jgi:hypothetical protein
MVFALERFELLYYRAGSFAWRYLRLLRLRCWLASDRLQIKLLKLWPYFLDKRFWYPVPDRDHITSFRHWLNGVPPQLTYTLQVSFTTRQIRHPSQKQQKTCTLGTTPLSHQTFISQISSLCRWRVLVHLQFLDDLTIGQDQWCTQHNFRRLKSSEVFYKSRKECQFFISSFFWSLQSILHSNDRTLILLHITFTSDQTWLLKMKSFLISQIPLITAEEIILDI